MDLWLFLFLLHHVIFPAIDSIVLLFRYCTILLCGPLHTHVFPAPVFPLPHALSSVIFIQLSFSFRHYTILNRHLFYRLVQAYHPGGSLDWK